MIAHIWLHVYDHILTTYDWSRMSTHMWLLTYDYTHMIAHIWSFWEIRYDCCWYMITHIWVFAYDHMCNLHMIVIFCSHMIAYIWSYTCTKNICWYMMLIYECSHMIAHIWSYVCNHMWLLVYELTYEHVTKSYTVSRWDVVARPCLVCL